VHVLLHRLMLQLLARHFPGSYLIAAEPDHLRYSAAFSSTTAAAAWCLTLQVSGPAQLKSTLQATFQPEQYCTRQVLDCSAVLEVRASQRPKGFRPFCHCSILLILFLLMLLLLLPREASLYLPYPDACLAVACSWTAAAGWCCAGHD
jgi:hypothetical protein